MYLSPITKTAMLKEALNTLLWLGSRTSHFPRLNTPENPTPKQICKAECLHIKQENNFIKNIL